VDDKGFPLPTVLAIGLAYTPLNYEDILKIQIAADLEKNLVRYVTEKEEWDSWYKAIFSSLKDSGISDTMIGIEFDFLNLCALRFGYHKIYDDGYG